MSFSLATEIGILEANVNHLRGRFISRFLPADPATPPSDYELDVKAFCVLSHAQIEEFIETLALKAMAHSHNEWMSNKRLTAPIVSVAIQLKLAKQIDVEKKDIETVYSLLLETFDQAKRSFSHEIFSNHGISIKYLKNIVLRLGIDLPQDPNLLNSLEQLSKARGEYAHHGRTRTILSPEDANQYVADCLRICKKVQENTEKTLK